MAGQTQSEIRALLASAGLSPRRRYGQNFLIDLNLMRKVVATAELQPGDTVLEVGCGTGSLTEMILQAGAAPETGAGATPETGAGAAPETGAGATSENGAGGAAGPHVVGVEIDHGLQDLLRQRLGGQSRFSLIASDVLAGKHEISPQVIAELRRHPPTAPGQYKLVANLPYQIATPLLMELLYVQPRFGRLVCTIQKEVGQRLTATPDTDAYGPISVIAATLADVRIVATFPPSAFWPRPQVESVLVVIKPLDAPPIAPQDVAAFVDFVRTSFLHRRKMIRKTLTDLVGPDHAAAALERVGLNPQTRPEMLAPPAWCTLFQHCRPPLR